MPFENTYGHGGLLTTAEDLLLWNSYIMNGKLGGNDLFKKQTSVTPLNNGRRNSYAAGLDVNPVLGWAAISHSGATAAYRANLEYFPQQELSIAWLSNTSQSDLGDIPGAVRNIFLKDQRPKNSVTTSTPTNIDLATYLPFTGAYYEPKTGAGMKIFLKDTVLISDPNGRLIPLSATSATVGSARILFNKSPRSFKMITSSGDTLMYVGVDSARTAAKFLTEYNGTYTSDETASNMEIVSKDGKLFSRIKGYDAPLTPVYKDGFSFPGGELFFERNKQAKISKLFVSISRARRVEFKKIK
jgi:hypothetical protein